MTFKHISLFIAFLATSLAMLLMLTVFLEHPQTVYAQEDTVILLESSLPGVSQTDEEGKTRAVPFGDYLNAMYQLGIGIATALAVVMIAVGGITYMTTGSITKKEGSLEEIRAALYGLLLALGSYLILQTINPNLVAFNLVDTLSDIKTKVEKEIEEQGQQQSNNNYSPEDCPTCEQITNGIPVKGTACTGTEPCQVASEINPKLAALSNEMNKDDITWEVTEAWPPTLPICAPTQQSGACHKNECHGNGTCVDANIRSDVTAESIKAFQDAASDSGLRAVYEVKTQAERDALVADGVNPDDIQVIPGINANHFSVYNIG